MDRVERFLSRELSDLEQKHEQEIDGLVEQLGETKSKRDKQKILDKIDQISAEQELEITDLEAKVDTELELQRVTIEEVDETYREMEDSIKVKQEEHDSAIVELTTEVANAQTKEKRKELTDAIRKKREEHRTEVKTIRSNTEEVVAQKRQDGGLGKFSAARRKLRSTSVPSITKTDSQPNAFICVANTFVFGFSKTAASRTTSLPSALFDDKAHFRARRRTFFGNS